MGRDFSAELHQAVTNLYQGFDVMTKIAAEARKEIDEQKIVHCVECGDFKKTGGIVTGYTIGVGEITLPGCEQYYCKNPKCPVRKGSFEEFQFFGCPLGWVMKEEGKAK